MSSEEQGQRRPPKRQPFIKMQSVYKLKHKPALPPADKPEAFLEENEELKEVVRRLTAIQSADRVSQSELEFIVAKTRYDDIRHAIDESENLIKLIFDRIGTFMRAVPDIFSHRQETEYFGK
jgi:hypothetical protein